MMSTAFGQQVIADDEDGVTGFCDRLLIGATSLPAAAIVEAARAAKGESLVIAAHVDRESFSIIGQLGFIPPQLALDAVEISRHMTVAEAAERFPDCRQLSGHHQFGCSPPRGHRKAVHLCFTIEDGTVAEIKKALAGRDGRKAAC